MYANLFNQYQKQMKDLQQQFFEASKGSVSGNSDQSTSFSNTLNTAMDLQKGFLKSALKAQEAGINMALSTQQKMLNNYLKMMQSSFPTDQK